MKRITGIIAVSAIIIASSMVEAHASKESCVAHWVGESITMLAESGKVDLSTPENVQAVAVYARNQSAIYDGIYDMGAEIKRSGASRSELIADLDARIPSKHREAAITTKAVALCGYDEAGK